jgi:hypothetical protein
MDTTVILDQKHYETVVAEARAAGQTPEEFLHSLIDARTHTFDDLLAPVRKGFEEKSDKELDELFAHAQKSARESMR